MCDKYSLDLLGSLPLEPSISQVCEEGKSLVKEKPESDSAKKFKLICKSRLSVDYRNPGEDRIG